MARTEPEGDVGLERGWTRRRAPRNAASCLISRALRWGARHLGWRSVKAYSDPRFGERGLAYKAAGFKPCPPSKDGNPFRYALIEGGRTWSDRVKRSQRGRTTAHKDQGGAEGDRVEGARLDGGQTEPAEGGYLTVNQIMGPTSCVIGEYVVW